MNYDKTRVAIMQGALDEKPISEYLAEWGAYSESNKYSCIFQNGEDLYPSLFVDDAKQVFYCHSCHRGGGTGKLIFYKMEQDYDIKNYYEALEIYLRKHEDLQRELGFNTLITSGHKVKQFSLEQNIQDMDNLLNSMGILQELPVELPPRSTERDFSKILNYCKKIQNNPDF